MFMASILHPSKSLKTRAILKYLIESKLSVKQLYKYLYPLFLYDFFFKDLKT